jgi:23S rRNA (cytidine1920-2'-O)/16S rRNA (cytidine1409-2'-O)-methyltransferase
MTHSRLDQALVERGLVVSRTRAQALIAAGLITVDGERADRADAGVADESRLEVKAAPAFVSRGGEKLAGALDDLGINPMGRVCLDAGASTGGFTDVLLQRGAERVYAVDVGYGQLDWRLRSDARVVVMERTNIRHLRELPGSPPDLAVADLSFISLRLVVPVIARLLGQPGDLVVLVKPQFEVGRDKVGKGGVVRSAADQQGAVDDFVEWAVAQAFTFHAVARARLKGAKGNQEFFVHLGVSDG